MSAKKKTINRVLALVLIVALIVPALLVVPVSADALRYLYGDVELGPLPSYDASIYPYAVLATNRATYTLRVSTFPCIYNGSYCVASMAGEYMNYHWDMENSSWTLGSVSGNSIYSIEAGATFVNTKVWWANYDIESVSGGNFMEGSAPVLVGGVSYPTNAETPSFTKNLTGATHYYLQGVAADPLVVEASVSDGGTIEYEWMLSGDLSGMVYGRGTSFAPPTNVPGEYKYVCVARNKVYNPNVEGEYIYSTDAYSFSDTVIVVASSTDPSEPEVPTTPDYSDKFDDLQNSMDEMPDKITDGMQDIMEQEKEQATQQGGQFVDDITGVVPNDSQGFIDALGSLVSVLSYDGTECVLPIPALTLPAIGGLFPSYTVMQAQEVDFEEFFAMMPPAIMLLVQSLLTVALIVYCFKELYDTVAYFFVLKGGNK